MCARVPPPLTLNSNHLTPPPTLPPLSTPAVSEGDQQEVGREQQRGGSRREQHQRRRGGGHGRRGEDEGVEHRPEGAGGRPGGGEDPEQKSTFYRKPRLDCFLTLTFIYFFLQNGVACIGVRYLAVVADGKAEVSGGKEASVKSSGVSNDPGGGFEVSRGVEHSRSWGGMERGGETLCGRDSR